jgi:hypothetical protein
MSVKHVPGGRMRRTGERAFGLVLLAKAAFVGAFVVMLVAAGAWTSWNGSQDTFRDDREQGTLLVESCRGDACSGVFQPLAGGSARAGITIEKAVVDGPGQTLAVAVRPGTKTVVRTGPAGVLHAWVPLGGALLLASLVLAGGLGLRRTGVGMALAGGLLVAGAFVAL